MRAELVRVALEWENCLGVAPKITDAIAEFDVAHLVGIAEEQYCRDGQQPTAVSRDFNVIHNGLCCEVTRSRPSGKKGSEVCLVGDERKKDWS